MRKKGLFNTIVISEEMQYEGVTVLNYKIEYPEFIAGNYPKAIGEINLYYKDKALALQKTFRTKLYQMAVTQYLYDVKNGFPVIAYEALQTFEVTYNKACIISLYFDNYEFTGGAHGLTTRSSDTWNLQTRQILKLSELFECLFSYRSYIIKKIIAQIKKNPDIYFDNYAELVEQNFNPDSFYSTKDGLVIYFQQYDIAPYSSGIREFLLPYNKCVMDPVKKCS